MRSKSASHSITAWIPWVPAFGWFESYPLGELRVGGGASLTLAAYLLPSEPGETPPANLNSPCAR